MVNIAKLKKPESITANEFKSAKWDEITSEREFRKSDIPTLELLCQWYAIVQQCIDDMTTGGDVQVAYSNKLDDLKALPQVNMLKQASSEIRAINKQLGINDEIEAKKPIKVSVLQSAVKDRQRQAKRAKA